MRSVGNKTQNRRPLGKVSRLESALELVKGSYQLTLTETSIQNVASQGFHSKTLALALVATDILIDEQPITLRGLMYRVVSAGWLPSTDKKYYKQLGSI